MCPKLSRQSSQTPNKHKNSSWVLASPLLGTDAASRGRQAASSRRGCAVGWSSQAASPSVMGLVTASHVIDSEGGKKDRA